jgi:hypothetical protein
MGYTHFWKREPRLSEVMFQSVINDLQKVLADIDIPLAGSEGEGEPFLSLDKIVFNGVAGQGCENFRVLRVDAPRMDRSKVHSFCKTQKLPYDLVVQVALIIMKHYFSKAIKVSSNGVDEDWQKAKDICQENLGYGSDFELETNS